jgi:7-cyano-7-deazaguanine synthase in queuosine biosynthesis
MTGRSKHKIEPPNGYGVALDIVERPSKCEEIKSRGATEVVIGTDIIFDTGVLDTYRYDGWSDLHYDLLVLCAAVEFADRKCSRRIGKWSRNFRLSIPVIALSSWDNPRVKDNLTEALSQLTGDNWNFTFEQGGMTSKERLRQRPLPFDLGKKFTIPYSDGLDSWCVSGLLNAPHKEDVGVRVRVSRTKDRVRVGERPFDRIPFRVRVAGRESAVRSRGFKFAAVTAIAGQLSGATRVIIPESGQGALGPVLAPLHNVYPDYRNHPAFFRKMERFIESLLGVKIVYEQPRLWNTKGETVYEFLQWSGSDPRSLFETRSCWQQRWNARSGESGRIKQCGVCAACLLRRMSMHAAGVREPAEHYTVADLTVAKYELALPLDKSVRISKTLLDYGIVGARHLEQLAEIPQRPKSVLRRDAFEIACCTGVSEQETLKNLCRLFERHADEWRDFVGKQGSHSFLNVWTEGGAL